VAEPSASREKLVLSSVIPGLIKQLHDYLGVCLKSSEDGLPFYLLPFLCEGGLARHGILGRQDFLKYLDHSSPGFAGGHQVNSFF
jgi:hypothetical protein